VYIKQILLRGVLKTRQAASRLSKR
jgi:hypothetical protein